MPLHPLPSVPPARIKSLGSFSGSTRHWISFSYSFEDEAFNLEKRRRGGTSSPYSSTLKGGYKENGRSPFTRSHVAKARGDGYNEYQEKFHLHKRKILFYSENTNH